MADIEANIGINLDTSRALAQLKNLQRQISVFNTEIARGGGKAAVAAAGMQQELVNSINATGQFSASMTSVRSTTESFTNALEKNKLSLGQTFRYAGASTKKFSHLFSGEFNTIEKVARERVKTIQTQFIKLGRDANGAIRSIAVRPLALDMNNLATQTAMAAQKQQILNQLLRQGSTNLLNWGKNTQWAGRQLMVGFTIPLALFGAAASKSFMELEEQAIRFKRVYGDLFTTPQQADQAFADMQKLGQEFTKYGVAVEKTIGLAASVAQMGKTGAELTAQVTEATRLAVLGGMEQEDALNTTVSLTNAFGVATEDLTNKINFLNAAENQTILSIQDFNEAVPRAGSVVAQLGGDVEDLAFFLTAMREGGIEAAQGANALKTSLGRLVNPTARARTELMAYGVDVVGIVERNAGNLRQTVMDLGVALDKLDPLEKSRAIERLFGKFQFARMSALFNNIMDEGSQAATILDLINSSAADLSTIAGRELGRVEESAATKFKSSVEQFQLALAPIGEAFLKLVTPIVEFGTRVLNAFNNLGDGTKAFVVGLVATLGAIGPVLIMTVGLLANGMANLLKIFLGLQTVFQRIRGGTKDVADQTEYMTQQQLEAAAAAASLNQSHSTLQQTFTSELAAVNNLVSAYQRMTAAQRNALGLPQVVSTTTAVQGFAKGRKVPGYKDGVVMVPGPRGAGDIQPAMLAPGEAVIPAAMAEKYGPLINAMVAGKIPGYMAGKTSATTGQASYDASHLVSDLPNSISKSFKELADSGRKISKTIYIMERELDEFGNHIGYTVERVTGYVDENLRPGDTIFATGKSYGPTALPQSGARNRGLYEDKDISKTFANQGMALGDWETYNDLEAQAQLLLQEKGKNTDAYRRNKEAIDQIILEYQSARAIVSQSNDQEEAKLAINANAAKALIKKALIDQKVVEADQAEILATQQVEEIQRQYRANVAEGMSSEDALKDATMALRQARYNAAEAIVIGREGVGSDTVRAFSTGRTYASGDPAIRERERLGLPGGSAVLTRNYSGQQNPSAGRSLKESMSILGPEYENIGVKIVRNASKTVLKGMKKATKQASPSKEAEKVGKNIGLGAIVGIEGQVDEAQVAGQNLAQATTEGFNNFPAPGTEPGARGGRGRFRTAGETTTPGQPLAFDIVAGKEVAAVQQQLSKSSRMASVNVANLASNAINGANKIGGLGIGLSSLAGGLSMVKGPLGDFASKLFPITSLMTALTFALNLVNAENIKTTLTYRLARVEATKRIKTRQIDAMAERKQTELNIASNKRLELANAELGRSVQKTAATINAAGYLIGVGAAGSAGKAVGGAQALQGAGSVKAFSQIFTKISSIGIRLSASLGKFGIVVGSIVRSIGGFLGALLGISAAAVGVIGGLALLAGGIYLLYKVAKDQEEKVKGLGDAAKLSGDKLKTLNDILGAELVERKIGGVGGIGADGLGARTGDEETQQSAQGIQTQLLESKEFKKEFGGVISSLRGASTAAAEQALTSMAFTLKTAGASEEMIAGIVNALLVEAGKTDLVLDFSSITLGTAQQSADDAAKAYADSFAAGVARAELDTDVITQRASTTAKSGASAFVGSIGGSQAEADRQLAAGALSSLILDANEQLRQGLIGIEDYNAAIGSIGETIDRIAKTSPEGLASASLLIAQMAKDMEDAGFEGVAQDVQNLLDLNTAGGLGAATTIMSARASGTDISESEMSALQAGAAEDAGLVAQQAAEAAVKAINERTEATVKATQAAKELADAQKITTNFETEVNKQNNALQGQIDTYADVSEAIADNTDIQDKNAFAQKVAADETLRNAWAAAQLQDAEAGNTEATKNFIAALQEQSSLQDQLNAQSALADIEKAIAQKEKETNVTDALGIALGDSAEAQGIMNNAQAMSFVLSELAAKVLILQQCLQKI
jgi:TP901 family phage tail tape measure protein